MNTRLATALIAGAFMFSGMSAMAQNGSSDSATASDSSSMTCQQMMDKAKPMVEQMTDQKKMEKAQKEMAKAQTDLDKGKMKTCKMRMKKVMDMTK
jgi:hypothetical protein